MLRKLACAGLRRAVGRVAGEGCDYLHRHRFYCFFLLVLLATGLNTPPFKLLLR
jgi:hypothetical protein